MSLDLGNVKNINKNPCAEKCNQELELELLKVDSTGSPVSDITLQSAVDLLNSRIRNRGLSAKEIVTCRDQVTNTSLSVDDRLLSQQQEKLRHRNHAASARSKAPNAPLASEPSLSAGSLVFIKSEGDKNRPRDLYLVVRINGKHATLQKLHGQRFMAKQYQVPLNMLYPMPAGSATPSLLEDHVTSDSDSDSEYEVGTRPSEVIESEGEDESGGESVDENVEESGPSAATSRFPQRERRPPDWLRSGEWET
jgi:hypothetical protein